jgi:pimeloyl-ACP methyl ester carboxylesterase
VGKEHRQYSGDMLRMSDADLRRIGRARFDNLELIWDYDAEAALRRLKVPLLWVLAEQDRRADCRHAFDPVAPARVGADRHLPVPGYRPRHGRVPHRCRGQPGVDADHRRLPAPAGRLDQAGCAAVMGVRAD